jgi:hypothetical protein
MQYVMYIDDAVCGKLNTREYKWSAVQVRLLQCAQHFLLCQNGKPKHICKEEK